MSNPILDSKTVTAINSLASRIVTLESKEFPQTINIEQVWNIPVIGDGDVSVIDISNSNVKVGGRAIVSHTGVGKSAWLFFANIPVDGSVFVTAMNKTGSPTNASGTLYILVLQ